MDGHDPDQEVPHTPRSQTWERIDAPSLIPSSLVQAPTVTRSGRASEEMDDAVRSKSTTSQRGSASSSTVAKFEEQTASRQEYEVGIKRHIGSSVKNLFFLAKGTGITRSEFEEIIRQELQCLGMYEEDE